MAKTDKKKIEQEEHPTVTPFSYRHIIRSYTTSVRFQSVCPKCNR